MDDEQNGAKPPADPPAEGAPTPKRFSIELEPYSISIDGQGLPLALLEDGLLRALAFVQRELLIQRLKAEGRSVQIIRGLQGLH